MFILSMYPLTAKLFILPPAERELALISSFIICCDLMCVLKKLDNVLLIFAPTSLVSVVWSFSMKMNQLVSQKAKKKPTTNIDLTSKTNIDRVTIIFYLPFIFPVKFPKKTNTLHCDNQKRNVAWISRSCAFIAEDFFFHVFFFLLMKIDTMKTFADGTRKLTCDKLGELKFISMKTHCILFISKKNYSHNWNESNIESIKVESNSILSNASVISASIDKSSSSGICGCSSTCSSCGCSLTVSSNFSTKRLWCSSFIFLFCAVIFCKCIVSRIIAGSLICSSVFNDAM